MVQKNGHRYLWSPGVAILARQRPTLRKGTRPLKLTNFGWGSRRISHIWSVDRDRAATTGRWIPTFGQEVPRNGRHFRDELEKAGIETSCRPDIRIRAVPRVSEEAHFRRNSTNSAESPQSARTRRCLHSSCSLYKRRPPLSLHKRTLSPSPPPPQALRHEFIAPPSPTTSSIVVL